MTTNDIRFDRALYVREVQQMLRTLAFDDARVPLISADGIFGKETADAVAAAQQCLHMTADGRVDYPTWIALVRAAGG
ncbi:MAG: peptidoglycan-binding protein, partial [Clostridia bacterium]|nr:peptidoglycan-binding protein [Clostridia bacterium]